MRRDIWGGMEWDGTFEMGWAGTNIENADGNIGILTKRNYRYLNQLTKRKEENHLAANRERVKRSIFMTAFF